MIPSRLYIYICIYVCMYEYMDIWIYCLKDIILAPDILSRLINMFIDYMRESDWFRHSFVDHFKENKLECQE